MSNSRECKDSVVAVPIVERLPDAWLAAADYLGLVLLTIGDWSPIVYGHRVWLRRVRSSFRHLGRWTADETRPDLAAIRASGRHASFRREPDVVGSQTRLALKAMNRRHHP